LEFVTSKSTVYAYCRKGHPIGSAASGELGSVPEGDTRCHAGLP
jgi:hypothetical protein